MQKIAYLSFLGKGVSLLQNIQDTFGFNLGVMVLSKFINNELKNIVHINTIHIDFFYNFYVVKKISPYQF